MRYIVVNTDRPRDIRGVEYYATVQNVIRYGLRKPYYPPGQYDIYRWPPETFSGDCMRGEGTRAYKRV